MNTINELANTLDLIQDYKESGKKAPIELQKTSALLKMALIINSIPHNRTSKLNSISCGTCGANESKDNKCT